MNLEETLRMKEIEAGGPGSGRHPGGGDLSKQNGPKTATHAKVANNIMKLSDKASKAGYLKHAAKLSHVSSQLKNGSNFTFNHAQILDRLQNEAQYDAGQPDAKGIGVKNRIANEAGSISQTIHDNL